MVAMATDLAVTTTSAHVTIVLMASLHGRMLIVRQEPALSKFIHILHILCIYITLCLMLFSHYMDKALVFL